MDENFIILETSSDETNNKIFNYSFPIYDQSNNLIEDPDLSLGYLKRENFTVHHESIPEQWHYQVTLFEFSNGENYKPKSNSDPHVKVIDDKKGIFSYIALDGEEDYVVVGQTISPIIDSVFVPAGDETKTIYRYILYTEKELSDMEFLANGPQLLAEAQETIDDLLLVIADLLGGATEEEEESI